MLKRRPPNDSANRTVLYQSPQPETPPGAAPRANGGPGAPTTAAPSAASLQGPLSDPWQSVPTTTTTIDAPPPTGSASARWIQPVPGAPLSPDELAAAFEPGPVPVAPPQPPVAAAPEAPTASVADAPAPAAPAAPAPAAPTAPGATAGGGGLDTSVRLVRVALARLVDDAGLNQGRDRHDTAGDEPDPAASAFEVVAADLAEEARRRAATEAARLRAEADAAVRDRLRAADLEAEAAVTAERDRLASVQADLRRIEAGVRAVAEPAAQALAGIGTGTARVRSAVAGALDQLERQERADRAERVAARVTVRVTEPDPPPEVDDEPTAVEDTEPTDDGPTADDPTAPTSAWRPGHFGR